MRDHILFLVNGREHRIGGAEVFETLSNHLRRGLTETGTKIVCAEGDCGACTVLVRRSAETDFLPINSCIQLLCQFDGASIVTVEGLSENGLTAVQEAMVACHGAQCGYCTPGFVMAMTALFERCDRLDERATRYGLTGNLCRCTGYEPIIKAALAVDGARAQKMRERYPHLPAAADGVSIDGFCAPTSLQEAVAFKAANPGCTILQGATDVGVWINKRDFKPRTFLSLAKIKELDALEGVEALSVGANVTLARFHEAIREQIPELSAILDLFGSPQIRNAGTLAGNIANGSPIGDTLPYLFVAGAELELAGTSGTRRVPIDSFYLGYKKFDLRDDEIITRVLIPIVGDTLKLYKVSRRRDLDISAFTAAVRLTMNDGRVDTARVAYGGVAPVVLRLPKTEAFLSGKPVEREVFAEAGRIARNEVAPISDVRGSKEYRLQLAENILSKFYYDVTR